MYDIFIYINFFFLLNFFFFLKKKKKRFKLLCKETWPNWRGKPEEGVEIILKKVGISPDDYCLGKTKLFIKKPQKVRISNYSLKKKKKKKKKKNY